LIPLPSLTGLEPQKFYGSYDTDFNKIFIFDAEKGGLGATKTLTNADTLRRMMELVRNNITDCPTGEICKGYCKQCIYTENCGEINFDLNRNLAKHIFLE